MTDYSTPAPAPAPGGPSGPRAGFGARLVAMLVDVLITGIASTVLQLVLPETLGSALGVLVGLAYYVYLEGSASGQTVGKRALNIRVVDFATGGPLGPAKAFIRWISRILSGIPCGLGYFWMLWDNEKQTWHDKIAGTVVVPTSAYPVASWPG